MLLGAMHLSSLSLVKLSPAKHESTCTVKVRSTSVCFCVSSSHVVSERAAGQTPSQRPTAQIFPDFVLSTILLTEPWSVLLALCCAASMQSPVHVALQEMRSDLRKVESSSLSTVVSPKSSSIDTASAEGRNNSGGSDYERRNLSGASGGPPRQDPPQDNAFFDNHPSLKRGM